MPNETTENLLAIAEQGERKLTATERREVLRYLEDKGDGRSNYQLAVLFKVDEAVIRKDKKRIIETIASSITPEYAMTFVAEYVKSQRDLIRQAKVGLEKCTPGGQMHALYTRLISDLEGKVMAMYQGIGAVPKQLGTLNVNEEKWVAVVADGVTTVTADTPSTPPALLTEGEIAEDNDEPSDE